MTGVSVQKAVMAEAFDGKEWAGVHELTTRPPSCRFSSFSATFNSL